MALIDKEAALDALMAERKHLLDNGQMGAEHILTHHGYNVIDDLPAVQPKHGRWISYSQFYPEVNTHWVKWECSECGYGRTRGWEGTTDGRCPEAKICENCGAIMEREVKKNGNDKA